MFDSIVVTAQTMPPAPSRIDMGSLVEAMLLYGKVTVIANYSIFEQVYTFFGGETLPWLLREGFLGIVYQENLGGIITQTKRGKELHGVIHCSSPDHMFAEKLREFCIDARGKCGAGRRLAQKLEGYIQTNTPDPALRQGTTEAILNPRVLKASTKIILDELVPGFGPPEGFKFEAHEDPEGIFIETDLDFALITEKHKLLNPTSDSAVSVARILSQILKFEEDVYSAASSMSELSCSSLSARLGVSRMDYILERSLNGQKKFDAFKEATLGNVMAIREAVNAGQVDVNDLIRVLDNSRRFKEWITSIPFDESAVYEYIQKIREKTFLETLPGKVVRYSVFTAVGLVASSLYPKAGTAITLGLGALDTFLFNKLLGGWKPNQYIDDHVKPLILS